MARKRKLETPKVQTIVAKALLCSVFAFFIYEIINQFNKLFNLALNPYFAIAPAILLYVFQEFALKKLRAHERVVSTNQHIKPKFDKVFYVIAWILVASAIIFVFVLWAGLVYKQTTNEYSDYSTTSP
jgi:hypothetical protein